MYMIDTQNKGQIPRILVGLTCRNTGNGDAWVAVLAYPLNGDKPSRKPIKTLLMLDDRLLSCNDISW